MPTIDYMDCFPTGAGTIAGQYMRRFWHPVLRAEDLKPGWAKSIRIMSEDFTLYRGESGWLGRGRLHPLPFSWLEVR